jgi:hypothetical protein
MLLLVPLSYHLSHCYYMLMLVGDSPLVASKSVLAAAYMDQCNI